MKKSFISALLVLALCLTMLPGTALAAEADIWGENIHGLFIPSTRYGALATNDTRNYFLSKDTSVINLTSPYVPFEKAKAQLFKDVTVIFVKEWEERVKEANLNDKNRYWTTTADGVVDFESGQETSFEGYNLGFDKESATLYLNGAYLKGATPSLSTPTQRLCLGMSRIPSPLS